MNLYEIIKKFIDYLINIFKKTEVEPPIFNNTGTTGTTDTPNSTGNTTEPTTPTKPTLRIGYFFEPTQTQPSTTVFQKLKSQGITDIFFRISNSGAAGWPASRNTEALKMVHDAGMKYHPWVWALSGGFQKTAQVINDGSDGILLDLETYSVSDYETYLSQMRNESKGKEFFICIKPTGWDGDQKYDLISKYCDYIVPMTYTGDYGVSNTTLNSYVKNLQSKYPGKIMPALETYESDNNPIAKSSTDLLDEIEAVAPHSQGILLFRYGLSNFNGGATINNTSTPINDTPSTTTTGTVDAIVQRIKDETGKSFNNFTELYALIVKHGRYCDPMYLDDQKSFNQAQQCVINEFKNIYDPEAYVQSPVSGQWTRRDCMTCVDWTQWGVKIAKAMGYQAIPYGVWCPGYEINHALFTIKGKEFTNWTVIDLAAAAAEGYTLGSHWCNAPSEDRKEPNWISYE